MNTATAVADRANRCRLLLVEDHADTRDMLVRLLSHRFDVLVAGCYETAMTAAASDPGAPPDLLITDVGLPGGRDGLALMRELRDRHHIPGIAVTGYEVVSAEDFRAAGFVRWLTKPIRFDELLKAIDDACAANV
ncbi:MAG TPA: response regulator [Tepidisphaeraceae bacterium]|nr:response regulator [Tepidisphaeraceae bacterium]